MRSPSIVALSELYQATLRTISPLPASQATKATQASMMGKPSLLPSPPVVL